MQTVVSLKDVSIFERTRSGENRKTEFYYQVRDSVTGRYGNPKSVMAVAKRLEVDDQYRRYKMNRNDAVSIIMMGLEKGIVVADAKSKEEVLLVDYVEKLLDYEASPWIREEAARNNGAGPGKRYIIKLKRSFEMYAMPLLKSTQRLNDFTKSDALKLQLKMHENKVSPTNINNAIAAIRCACNYADAHDIIQYNPMLSVKPYKVVKRKQHILDKKETANVVSIMECHHESPVREGACLAVKLAIYSGMREGEIRALRPHQISPIINDDGEETGYSRIYVDGSWNDTEHKISPTKGKYNRTTVIETSLAEELLAFGKRNPTQTGDDLIFWATKDKGNMPRNAGKCPVVKNSFLIPFYDALSEMGIDEETRDERRITFHTLRHFYDTQMKDQERMMEPYKEELRKAVGHKSKRVDELIYTHDTTASLLALGVMSSHLLDLSSAQNS